MASISIMVTDNEHGVINNSFNFTEQEVKRIREALSYIYKPMLDTQEILENGHTAPYKPTPQEVFSTLANSLMSSIINSCHNAEVEQLTNKFRENTPAIEVRPQNG